MKFLIQRVNKANVEVSGRIVGGINEGILIFIGINKSDTSTDAEYLIKKSLNLRLFAEKDKHFSKSVLETKKEILLVSQFTLYANCDNGRRPDFTEAASSKEAKIIYDKIVMTFKETGLNIQTGEFGAKMMVNIENNGPVTIMLDSNKIKK